MLKKDGKLLVLYMAWLPYKDKIARASEELVLKYSPDWSGAGEIKRPIKLPDCVYNTFETVYQEEYNLNVPFTRESWHGRMKTCRGVGGSLSAKELDRWDEEHRDLLERIAPWEFEVMHYAALTELKLRRN